LGGGGFCIAVQVKLLQYLDKGAPSGTAEKGFVPVKKEESEKHLFELMGYNTAWLAAVEKLKVC
jgi:hypothetical protein